MTKAVSKKARTKPMAIGFNRLSSKGEALISTIKSTEAAISP
jgi:hypothetical protein